MIERSTLCTVLSVLAWVSLLVWLGLAVGRGGFWRMNVRLGSGRGRGDASAGGDAAAGEQQLRQWPAVAVVVPARDEADILPSSLPTLLTQDYPGPLEIILVDDASTDGTGQVAAALAERTQIARPLTVLRTDGPPSGWAGKVAAMNRGLAAAGDGTYVLFTDSDIAHPPDSVQRLVEQAEAGSAAHPDGLDLVSLMARLSTDSAAERMIVPAFVYSFFQLYPPAWVNKPGARTAAAAGGCMLVRRARLEELGGLTGIADARIDDVALGTLLKRGRPGARSDGEIDSDTGKKRAGRIWLGTTTEVRSLRPYPRLADLWDMIARSAYTQLRYSPWLLAGTVLGLGLSYGVPPVLGVIGLFVSGWRRPVAAPCLAAWAVMTLTYIPVLRLYGLRAWRAPLLPGVMALYGAMTVDSARRHMLGRGGSWKGRVIDSVE